MLSQRNPSQGNSPGLQSGSLRTMLTGIITLITVMGIGRFSLTPQIPLMIHDGIITLTSAGLLAAMNYVGYLLGALHASRIRSQHTLYLKSGLVLTIAVTLLSGTTSSMALQCLFRFLSGIGGAWSLIIITSWTQLVLAGNRSPRMSAAVFTGPGIGITLTGLLAWIAGRWQFDSSDAWYLYGGIALVATLLIFGSLPRSLPVARNTASGERMGANLRLLLLTYSLAGFGYILPATFLSQMAHALFQHGALAAFFWPLFGLSAVVGVILVILFAGVSDTRISLALAMVLQGVGVAASVVITGTSGLLISTILTGLGFLSIMQLSMRLAREISSGSVSKNVGTLTAGYATGQLPGPLVSSASVMAFGSLEPALLLAATGLVAGGAVVYFLIKAPT
ncbi:YbfB/YjiJ family MFS transporter [Tatumella citrea]|uniref:MFS superfamily transporter n=1 Tax=Tatumella citrea TaxID=53336 RepID=A0A1Y0L4G1_TATCI|nr:YbfB/YjiJ family MFS transporter [Tatumella citrea]ARU92635.1 MFS superfamily transporter precursor [Tatumella citrea]ARU96671.1 MFS superfamily transporter precursor [Tatumella citrea]